MPTSPAPALRWRHFLAGTALAGLGLSGQPAAATSVTTIFSIPGNNAGTGPEAGVIPGPNGTLYGSVDRGGTNDSGLIFQLIPQPNGRWLESVLYRFDFYTTGGYPLTLVAGTDGALYGMTFDGGAALDGALFKLAPPVQGKQGWTRTRLHDFAGGTTDGALPSGLILEATGALVGTTDQGGIGPCQSLADGTPVGCGVAFRLSPPAKPGGAWTETLLHRFTNGADGSTPNGRLLAGPGGVYWGTTTEGGGGGCTQPGGNLIYGCGTVFQLTPPAATGGAWSERVLYAFQANPGDPATPVGGVVADSAGCLYGATAGGGVVGSAGYGLGTIYRLTPPATSGGPWTMDVLYRFTGEADGFSPQGGLFLDVSGRLYGTTYLGGGSVGTLFELDPPASPSKVWTKRILHRFDGAGDNGAYPTASLAAGADGALYGTTYAGGEFNVGSVFAVRP